MATGTLTYDTLKHMTVAELRDIAAGVQPALQGYTQMNKEHLLDALCKALKITTHAHHEVVGLDKTAIKAQLQVLKKERDAALEAHDHEALHVVRRKMHHLKRRIHGATM